MAACALATWGWLAAATGLGWDIARVLLCVAFLIIPPGVLIVGTCIPSGVGGSRVALVGSVGYVTATFGAVVLGGSGLLPWFPYLWAGLAVACGIGVVRRMRGTVGRLALPLDAGFSAEALPLVAIIGLSLVAITPLMTPVEPQPAAGTISYGYIDAYQGVAMIQGLVRTLPLTEHYSLAGLEALAYPDFHYTFLAMVSRLTGVSPFDMYFCHGAILLVLIGVPLAYAIGRQATGEPLGGLVAATLLYVGVMPNLYDLNPSLANVSVPYMPTFYQTHFYSPRLNQHEGAGALLVMTAILGLQLAERAKATRDRVCSLAIAGCCIAALSRFRSQHLLSAGPAFLLTTAWLGLKLRDWRMMAGLAACVALLVVLAVQTFGGTYDPRSAALVIRYGNFGREILERWYLPARLQPYIAAMHPLVAPAVAAAAWVAFRFIGLNLGVLIAGRAWQLLKHRQVQVIDLFPGLVILAAIVTSITVQRDVVTLGPQIVQLTHLMAVMLVVVPLVAVVKAVGGAAHALSVSPRLVGGVVLVALTAVASRAADAALHDQLERGYSQSAAEVGADRWIRSHTSPNAVIAAHPEHRVNKSGDRVSGTDVLSVMTGRLVFVQRASGAGGRIFRQRVADLRTLYATPAGAAVCEGLAPLNIDYLIEYADTPFAGRTSSCVREVFAAADVRVLEVIK